MATLSNGLLRFKIKFDIVTGKITFTDLLSAAYNPTYGQTLADLKGIIKIYCEASQDTLYENAGFENEVFTAPDIIGSTATWVFANGSTGILIPTDTDGNYIKGNYIVDYLLTNGISVWSIQKTYDFQYDSPEVVVEMTIDPLTAKLTVSDGSSLVVGGVTPSLSRERTVEQPLGGGMSPAPGTDTTTTLTSDKIFGGDPTDPDLQLWTGEYQATIGLRLTYLMELWGTVNWVEIVDVVSGYNSLEVSDDDCSCIVRTCVKNLGSLWETAMESGNSKRANELQIKVVKVLKEWMNYQMYERCGDSYSEFCTKISDIVEGEGCQCITDTQAISHPVVPYAGSGGGGGTPQTGPQGPTGPGQGATGDTGPTGDAITGPTGDAITGPTGPIVTGPTGPIVTGPTGADGTQIYTTSGQPSNSIGVDGDYAFDPTGRTVYFNDGGTWESFTTLGITGPTGPEVTGPTGPTGPVVTGPTGAQGDTGPIETGPTGPIETGPTGPTGDGTTGPTGIIAVTLSTVDPLTVNVPPCLGAQWYNTVNRKLYWAVGTDNGTQYKLMATLPA